MDDIVYDCLFVPPSTIYFSILEGDIAKSIIKEEECVHQSLLIYHLECFLCEYFMEGRCYL